MRPLENTIVKVVIRSRMKIKMFTEVRAWAYRLMLVSLGNITATETPKIYSLNLWYLRNSTSYYALDLPLQVTSFSQTVINCNKYSRSAKLLQTLKTASNTLNCCCVVMHRGIGETNDAVSATTTVRNVFCLEGSMLLLMNTLRLSLPLDFPNSLIFKGMGVLAICLTTPKISCSFIEVILFRPHSLKKCM